MEILGDFLRLIGKGDVVAQMTERGTLQQTADWLDTQLARFTGLLDQASALFSDAWAALSPANLPNLLDNIADLAGRAFRRCVRDVGAFAWDVIAQVLVLVKKSLLGGWPSTPTHARVPPADRDPGTQPVHRRDGPAHRGEPDPRVHHPAARRRGDVRRSWPSPA